MEESEITIAKLVYFSRLDRGGEMFAKTSDGSNRRSPLILWIHPGMVNRNLTLDPYLS